MYFTEYIDLVETLRLSQYQVIMDNHDNLIYNG